MRLKAPAKSYIETEHYIDSKGLASVWLDISKVQENLGWTPSISIEEGVKEMIQFYLGGQGLSTSAGRGYREHL
jgi:nucleoside-diphosphate-sugar epimerase